MPAWSYRGAGAALLPLLPADWAGLAPMLAQPLALRLSGGGAPEALALRGEGDLGSLRAEATATLDTLAGARQRHPDAAPSRRAAAAGAAAGAGGGGLARPGLLLRHRLGCPARGPGTVTAEHLDLVAGSFRGRGQMTLALDGARPRLTGTLRRRRAALAGAAAARDRNRSGSTGCGALEAELAVEAAGWRRPAAWCWRRRGTALKLAGGTLRLEEVQARLGGGTLKGALAVDGAATPPRLALEARLADAIISGPLFDLPLDLGAGRVEGTGEAGRGRPQHGGDPGDPGGRGELAVRDGVLVGLRPGGAAGRRRRSPSLARPRRRCARPWPAARRPSSGWRAAAQAGRRPRGLDGSG